jgi:hypothetical protein
MLKDLRMQTIEALAHVHGLECQIYFCPFGDDLFHPLILQNQSAQR